MPQRRLVSEWANHPILEMKKKTEPGILRRLLVLRNNVPFVSGHGARTVPPPTCQQPEGEARIVREAE